MANGFILIVVGLLLFYVVISDKFHCLLGCAACLTGKLDERGSGESSGTPGGVFERGGANPFPSVGKPLLMPGEALSGMLGLP